MAVAEKLSKQALLARPYDTEATILYALVCARTGKRAAAIVYLENALKRDPESFEAQVALSTLLFAAGKLEEALIHGKRAIDLRPNDRDAHRHLIRDLIAHGHKEDAMVALRTALSSWPNEVSFHQDLAAVLTDLGRGPEAIREWESTLALDPNILAAWLKLGGLRLAEDDYDAAIKCGREAVRIDPDSADARVLLALALAERNGALEAEGHLRRAVELNEREYLAHSALGLVLQEQGRFTEAETWFMRATALRPTHGLSYCQQLRARKATAEDEPLLRQIASLIEDPDANLLDRSYMHYALGKAREDLGEYGAAMRHYDSATSLAASVWFTLQPPDTDTYRFTIQQTIEAFTAERIASIAKKGLSSEKPLLVIGMMRSGTTLVEQILSSHPMVEGGGELEYWHEHASRVFDRTTRRIDEEGLLTVARGYLNELGRIGPGAGRVTDKLPHNYAMLGFVMSAIPNAKVIHVRRNPIDNCLSIYTTPYSKAPAFTLIKDNIVFAYRQYLKLMSHWRKALPRDQVLNIEYEELIGNREGVTRRMIEFAGLPWDDACLHHETNVRCVNTPSLWQVRQPIYETSVERWRRFEPWIGEFMELADSKNT